MLDLFLVFLRLGFIGFGGPIALVALIEQAVCKEKSWLTTEEFARIFSICKLLPGPVAVQVTMCVGYRRHGRIGGLISGIAFTLPAIILMLILSILYVHNGQTENRKTLYLFKFMQDSTLAVIGLAVWSMGRSYINSWKMITLTVIGGIIIFYLPAYEPIIILAFGMLGVILSHNLFNKLPLVMIVPTSIWHGLILGATLPITLQMLWIFLKAGEFSFGTGLAIIPLLHGDLVTAHHWLTNKEFLDGVALGQITPGPTTVSVVFFGYKIAGLIGVIIALLGFYVPALFNTLFLLPLLWKKLTSTPYLQVFINFAFPVIVGGIISAGLKIGIGAVTTWYDALILILSLIIISRKILPIWAVIPLFGFLGLGIGYV